MGGKRPGADGGPAGQTDETCLENTVPEWLSIILDGIGAAIIATGATLLLTWRATWTPYADQATKLAIDIDHIFIRYPHLRVYFYDKEPLPAKNHELYARATAVTEFVADCLEGIWDNEDIYNRGDWQAWYKYIMDTLSTSPGLATLLDEDDPDDPWYPSLGDARKLGKIDIKTYKRPNFRRLRHFWRDLKG
jgi:hypothetical protein